MPTHPAFEGTRISHMCHGHEKFTSGIPPAIFDARWYDRPHHEGMSPARRMGRPRSVRRRVEVRTPDGHLDPDASRRTAPPLRRRAPSSGRTANRKFRLDMAGDAGSGPRGRDGPFDHLDRHHPPGRSGDPGVSPHASTGRGGPTTRGRRADHGPVGNCTTGRLARSSSSAHPMRTPFCTVQPLPA